MDDIMVHTIRITFGSQTQPQIEVQQGDYNSRTIRALCYTSSGGAMSFDGQTVSVVYSISGTVSAEYPVQVTGNVLSFTMPGLASASVGAGSMQVRIYGSESLLQSAIIPYVVKASLDPGPAEEDQVPMLVMLVQQAQQAIAGANAAASTANQVADEIQQKADSGAFNGKDGLNAPQIDDTQITNTNPWSSMQIVKTVCPPFSVSGPIVQCTPVANYPLGVKASWEPRQEGEGDPSPENVRPITGVDEVKVTRCGKNLLNPEIVTAVSGAYGLTVTYENENIFHIVGKPNNPDNGVLSFVVAETLDYSLAGKGLAVTAFNLSGNLTEVSAYGLRTSTEKAIAISAYLDNTVTYDARIQLAVGVENLATYEPYTGTTATLTLPETIYGGTVDAVTGEGVKTWEYIASYNGESIASEWISDRDVYLEDATPTTGAAVAYKLATPVPITATGSQSLPALPGTNTVYTDADTVSVSGLSDPVSTIASLQARVSALESAQTNM